MSVDFIYYLIIFLIIFEYIFTRVFAHLNIKNWSDELPLELKDIYDEDKYKKSMQYDREKYKFGIISSTFSFLVLLFVVIFGLFGFLDSIVRSITDFKILQALIFFGIVFLIQTIISTPFSYYSTFVIEKKYGFNKQTKSLFFGDLIKSLILGAIIGGIIMSLIVWIYLTFTSYFWILAWIVVTLFSVFFMMFYSSLIVPLFNKQTPLEDGELRKGIEDFAKSVGFQLDNIFVIDGSKRSTKANAYFSGLGSKKRIVLYDTLIKDLTISELVAVLAHEIGHYKKKHNMQMLAFSIIQTGLIMFVLGFTLEYHTFSQALGADTRSFQLGLVVFGIIFTPVSMILSLFGNMLSRKNEYEADAYSRENYNSEDLKNALIKLSKNNLSNLTPHPAYEFFYYSHPTVLKRLKALSN